MSKRKVLFVVTKSIVGGAQKWIKEQIDVLNSNGFECFICTNETGWLTSNAKTRSSFVQKTIEKRFSIIFIFRLYRYVRNNKIDLIVGSSANGGIYSRIVGLLTLKKVIYVSHGWSSVYNGGRFTFFYNWIERILSKATSKILCVSENDYTIATSEIGIECEKLVTITNKIYPLQKIEGNSLRNEYNSSAVKLLFLGRLAPPKNPILLISAIKNNQKYVLDIIGQGPDYLEIQEYINLNNIKNVRLLGEIVNFTSFNNYDIFTLISLSEGLPMSAIEALSFGLPILISNVGGCNEVINANGYLTNNTQEDILKGLETIDENFIDFSNNSFELFRSKFNLLENQKQYIDFYNGILDK